MHLGMDPTFMRLFSIFQPHHLQKRTAVINGQMRFVHYTSPEAAMKMIRSSEVWLRKSTTMNDFSEIQHGLGCLDSVMRQPEMASRFRGVLDYGFAGLSSEVESMFHQWRVDLVNQTYLTCISEHGGPDEDRYGRLSMWRAYGGIAVVLNPAAFMATTDALSTYSSPVRYRNEGGFYDDFASLIQQMEHDRDFIAAQPRETIKWMSLQMLRYFGLCTKHPAFMEEREWRIFHSPNYQSSPKMTRSIEIIRGVPQPIYRLPLANDPQAGLNNLSVPEIVEKVLIGPTPDAHVQAEAFAEVLKQAGVNNPWERIVVTAIPLRQ